MVLFTLLQSAKPLKAMDGRASTGTEKGPDVASTVTDEVMDEKDINCFNGKELKPLFAEKGRKTKSLLLTDEYQLSISRVKEWFAFSLEKQNRRKEDWKKLNQRERRKFSDAIPNQKRNKMRPKNNAGVSTRARKDKRQKHRSNESATSLVRKRGHPTGKTTAQAGEEEEGATAFPIGLSSTLTDREKISENMKPNKKRKRSRVMNLGNTNPKIIGAHDILAQNDQAVWEQQNRVLHDFATYIDMIQPTFATSKETTFRVSSRNRSGISQNLRSKYSNKHFLHKTHVHQYQQPWKKQQPTSLTMTRTTMANIGRSKTAAAEAAADARRT
jgi:hypothetical protein